MPWKDQLKRFKADWDKFNAEHNLLPGNQSQQQQQQQQQYPQQYQQQQPYPQQQQYYNPQQQQQYNRPPPAQPYQSPPPDYSQTGDAPTPQTNYLAQSQGIPPPQQPINPNPIYWQPDFSPSNPITNEWDPKLGNNNGWGNNELEFYTANPENSFYTNDRKLIIRAIANNSHPDPAQKYTSARLVSRQRLSKDRGVVSAVLSSPCAPGIWPAFWLLPFEPFSWPSDGEVDIMESWNGDRINHSCLHWGNYDARDWNKHITQTTRLEQMPTTPVRYDFAWDQPGGVPGQGRMLWYIDGRPVMKAQIPKGTRPMRDSTILLNVAMGGNVCAGQRPRDGAYDFVVHFMAMMDEMDGGWERFERDWQTAPNGKVG